MGKIGKVTTITVNTYFFCFALKYSVGKWNTKLQTVLELADRVGGGLQLIVSPGDEISRIVFY